MASHRRRDAHRNLVAAEVEGTLAELRAAADRLEAAHGTAAAGKSWFQAATLDFSAGLVEARDLVEAYEGYVESQGALAHAAYDVRVARGRLAFATGVLPMLGAARCEVPSS
jgi:outer membrane protein TolC